MADEKLVKVVAGSQVGSVAARNKQKFELVYGAYESHRISKAVYDATRVKLDSLSLADCQRIASGPVLLNLTQAGMTGASTGQHPQQLADAPMMSERERLSQLMGVIDRVKLYAGRRDAAGDSSRQGAIGQAFDRAVEQLTALADALSLAPCNLGLSASLSAAEQSALAAARLSGSNVTEAQIMANRRYAPPPVMVRAPAVEPQRVLELAAAQGSAAELTAHERSAMLAAQAAGCRMTPEQVIAARGKRISFN